METGTEFLWVKLTAHGKTHRPKLEETKLPVDTNAGLKRQLRDVWRKKLEFRKALAQLYRADRSLSRRRGNQEELLEIERLKLRALELEENAALAEEEFWQYASSKCFAGRTRPILMASEAISALKEPGLFLCRLYH